MPQPITKNTLFYGDNLPILRDYIPDASIDLVYLDPPFNSQRTYNVLFKDEKSGNESESQITAFDDTWHWTRSAEEAYRELVEDAPGEVGQVIGAMRSFIGTNQMMAYLVMMAIRLVELHRVLKPNGSLYLHCDPTASHYLKVILDTIFGLKKFQSEIIWKRYGAHNDAKGYGAVHDVILYYSKNTSPQFHKQYQTYEKEYTESRFRFQDADGRRYSEQNLSSPNPRPNLTYEFTALNGITYSSPRNGWKYTRERMENLDRDGRLHYPNKKNGRLRLKNYLDEMSGVPVQDVWTDIVSIGGSSPERLGYPTQKPVALLERIILTSSDESAIVLDPFCGCGTAIAAAQKLGRRWVGIDITHLSIALQKYRLRDSFSIVAGSDYAVIGEPVSLDSARMLASEDRYQFQWWALSLVQARPLGASAGQKQGRKGADQGIDGVINFIDDAKGSAKRVLVQVKSGKVSSRDIRDLAGTVDREKAAIGVFITLESPTTPMTTEATGAGFYYSEGWNQNYPKIQILTIEALLQGAKIEMPQTGAITFQQAPKQKPKSDGVQGGLFGKLDEESDEKRTG